MITKVIINDNGNKIPNFYIDADRDNPIKIDDLEKILLEKLEAKEESDRGIVLEADNTVDIGYVVEVMEIASNNNFKIVLATDPLE